MYQEGANLEAIEVDLWQTWIPGGALKLDQVFHLFKCVWFAYLFQDPGLVDGVDDGDVVRDVRSVVPDQVLVFARHHDPL